MSSSAMIVRLKIRLNHEELFAERYQRLLRWSMQLTGNERDLAEDLLHDAYVQFTFSQPDLSAIKNLDGYFYTMLRNLHLSHVRRETREHWQQLSVVEFDSAEDSLQGADLRDQLRVQDELRRVCHFVCVRKETARAASVLILRFFHGYYPSEIVQLLRTSRQAVDVQLLIARREARLSFEEPGALSFVGAKTVAEIFPAAVVRPTDDFLYELRQAIFNSNRGVCFSRKQLRDLYGSVNGNPMQCVELAHLISCATCLDEVNRILGLPLLSERNPTETLGRDKRPKGPGGGGPVGGDSAIRSWRRRARRVFEHKPQTLCVAVNGYVQASQPVNSELNELNLNVDLSEKISFVEVFSDQRVRLLLLNVEELPPAGPGEHVQLVKMSDGRTLSVKLEFRSPWPTLQVAYHDPTFKQVRELLDNAPSGDAWLTVVLPASGEADPEPSGHRRSFQSILLRLRELGGGFWLRPATISAMFGLILFAAFALWYWRTVVPPVTAAGLLRSAAANEETLAARTGQVLHRTINLEERQAGPATGSPGDGQLISRRRLELWESGAPIVRALRVYDEQDRLVNGEWVRSNGSRTVYNHAAKLHAEPPRNVSPASLNFNDIWTVPLSAAEYATLIGNLEAGKVEASPSEYRITYQNDTLSHNLKSARLVLRRPELRAISQTLVISQGGELREYRFSESAFEQRTTSSVPPAIFEPDPELLSSTARETRNAKLETESPAPDTRNPAPAIATAELEVEVLRLLHQAGADLGEQISVVRSAEGQLHVQGVVETTERKRELLRALEAVKDNPAVRIQISSAAEAAERLSKSASSSGAIVVERSVSSVNTIPVEAELRRHFSDRGMSEQQIENSIQRFANSAISRSSQVLQHAWALKRLAERFSPDELRSLSPETRASWLAMIGEHSRALQRVNSALRQELQPIFLPASPSDSAEEGIEIRSDADLMRVAERLLGICTSNHKLVSSAFTVSSDSATGSAIKSAQFQRSLKSAEKLAAKISRQ